MEVFECFVCSALDVMLAPLGVIPNGLPRTEVEVEVEVEILYLAEICKYMNTPHFRTDLGPTLDRELHMY